MWTAAAWLAASAAAMTGPEAGVPLSLARERAARVSEVRYVLAFNIPASTAAPVTGRAEISFNLKGAKGPLALDFRKPEGTALTLNVPFEEKSEHVLLALKPGRHTVVAEFTAGSAPLNRNPDYLYTLLVPARAREVFPCFDQPDLKARFALTLSLPAEWKAATNGAERSRVEKGGRATALFAETKPMSTYLFAFAAGKFSEETAVRDGRTLRFLHRETDAAKVARNREPLFDLTAQSLAWMEKYAGVAYPWGKLDMVVLPAFQYGGMEHPGAIFYSASHVLLDEAPTQAQLLGRAGVIAHEVAHMWFGDLVTMRWFDDVWLKEVFANFMAAKMVEPQFPGMDHALRFLMSHQPHAYGIDATEGSHPILQPLDNLDHAGLLYGWIIYAKAPVVMRQLERALGERSLRQGLREYLKTYAFGNATWADLISLLQKRAGKSLAGFSHSWVEERGRPVVTAFRQSENGRLGALLLTQTDPLGRGLLWDQTLEPALYYEDGSKSFPVALSAAKVEVAAARGLPEPLAVLPDRSGLGYAEFLLDPKTQRYLLENASSLPQGPARGQAWLCLWDDVRGGRLKSASYLDAVERALPLEKDELIVQYLLDTTQEAFWRFLPLEQRDSRAARLEPLLWDSIAKAPSASLRKAYARAFWKTAISGPGVEKIRALWDGLAVPKGLTLSEEDRTALALQLAVRGVPDAADVLKRELARVENPDRRARLQFLVPAAAGDEAARDAFFAGLSDPANRRHEPWVETALSLLNHPLREEASLRYVRPALERLEDIQRTGDIFFPQNWLSATLDGHASPRAAKAARDFLTERADYPLPLRRLILQSLYSVEAAARAR